METLQHHIVDALERDGSIPDTRKLQFPDLSNHIPSLQSSEGQSLVQAALSSLASREILEYVNHDDLIYHLKPEGLQIVKEGSHEYRFWAALPVDGQGAPMTVKEIAGRIGSDSARFGQGKAMQNKWVKKMDSGFVKLSPAVADTTRLLLEEIESTGSVPDANLADLKKRNFITQKKVLWFSVSKGVKFTKTIQKLETDLTTEMLTSGSWQSVEFKKYNFQSEGAPTNGGALHPLLKVREELRNIFLEMGFTEMPTSQFVDSCFWNFDALFVPQQHPAREAQDTFYISDPAASLLPEKDYYDRVAQVHARGGYGSLGYRAPWSDAESTKLVLRTHTTARSAFMLRNIAKQPDGFKPAKLFSIDRVFRNEATDNTHLAEFHQVEGVVVDYNLTLADLIGFMQTFFAKMGLHNLRFKPAYNPYTEPSMEIFAFHPHLEKWVEIGNSGMFRPEMLEPMGLPKGVRAHGWGLSLERPTMIRYGISNIRTLVGHKVSVEAVENSAAVRF